MKIYVVMEEANGPSAILGAYTDIFAATRVILNTKSRNALQLNDILPGSDSDTVHQYIVGKSVISIIKKEIHETSIDISDLRIE